VSSFEYKLYNGKNNSIGYYFSLPSVGYFGEEYKFENNRLVYYALTKETGEAYITAEKIEQDNQSITITTRHSVDGSNFPRKYYNIPRTELLDLFLTNYVELICTVNEMVNCINNVSELYTIIRPLVQGRTARELAIFRNCLYAIKGYRFSTASWAEFFNKYLSSYTGRYTNDQVTAMFTENEKWLLDLVMRYESRQ
jgi:hypothetical protein